MKISVAHNYFSASDAEAVTDLPATAQRNMRRWGYLPPSGGKHARFDAEMLGVLLSAARLRSCGVGPETLFKAMDCLRDAAAMMAYYAVIHVPECWQLYPNQEYPGDLSAAPGLTPEALAHAAAGLRPGAILPRYFVMTGLGEPGLCRDLETVFGVPTAVAAAEKGAAIVLNLEALGILIGTRVDVRLNRHLFDFEVT